MKKLANAAFLLTFLFIFPQRVQAASLVPVGQVVGLEVGDDTVIVAAFDDALGGQARAAGLQVGDDIQYIDGKTMDSPEDVRGALEHSDGSVELTVERGGKQMKLKLEPAITKEGPRLGVYLRRGITGIGTVTFYDPETGNFGTLGHGVNDSGGKLLMFKEGTAYRASILSVKKGLSGEPGQLRGAIESGDVIGALSANTARGVFGHAEAGWEGEAIPTARFREIRTGSATILSTVSGTEVREYSVEILKIYPASRSDGRNLLIKVTDPALLETTGGIVQGMSGSPIMQDGKLIGAVTHVLVNDPTTGYGIFIENMLDAAA